MAKSATLIAPAVRTDRYTEIDALRGLALFGILMANLPIFVGLGLAEDPETQRKILGSLTQASHAFIVNFILDGKFYTVFSLLFGLGFALQLDRLEQRGADGIAIFRRRMTVLLFIGLFHLSFIWGGDILTLYALIGFTLPFFHRITSRSLLALSALLIFLVPLIGTNLFPREGSGPLFFFSWELYEAFGGDREMTYFDDLKYHFWPNLFARAASEWSWAMGEYLLSWRISKVLGIMLLGMWAGRKLVRGELIGNGRLLWPVVIIGAVISIPLNIIYAQQAVHSGTHWSSLIGTVPAALAYAAAFLLFAPHFPRAVDALANAGRMALTNYLTTSIVCTIIFTGAAFGLMGSVTMLQGWAFGFLFFGLMLSWSSWWLARHKQGPMEALWRRLTYPSTRTGKVSFS